MLLFPFYIKGLYSLLVIAVLAPLLVIQGGNAKCANRIILAASEFLGWISYPVYCLHFPVMSWMRAIDERVAFSTRFGIPCAVAAIIVTLLLAVTSAHVFDRLKLQQKLSNHLRGAFAAVI
jgi:peptidoglycan/LPS O-acetylase OafA/YrhL